MYLNYLTPVFIIFNSLAKNGPMLLPSGGYFFTLEISTYIIYFGGDLFSEGNITEYISIDPG